MSADLPHHAGINGAACPWLNLADVVQVVEQERLFRVYDRQGEESRKGNPQDHQGHGRDREQPPAAMALVKGPGRKRLERRRRMRCPRSLGCPPVTSLRAEFAPIDDGHSVELGEYPRDAESRETDHCQRSRQGEPERREIRQVHL